MTPEQDSLTVQIRYRDLEKTIAGSPEQVWLLLNKFFEDLLPSFAIAQKLALEVDLQNLVRDCNGLIALTEEGPYVLVARSKLTDNETLALLLLASYVGHKLGRTEAIGLSKEELQAKLGKDAKITSTRLGELIKSEMAMRTADEKYKITTFGLVQMQREILPRIRTKARI